MSDYLNIPLELRQLPQWCLWRAEDIGSPKVSKVPYQCNGELANVNDPSTWAAFEQVIAAKTNIDNFTIPYSGIGFVFQSADPYCFIDLDDPNGDGVTIDRQLKIFKEFDSYAEVSPSGKGLHIIIRGSIPSGRRRSSIEIYSIQRYATMTGIVHNAKPIVDYQDKLTMLYEQMGSGPATLVYTGDEKEIHDDKQIIDVASKAINGEKFTKLLLGNWQDSYPSQSEADFAFMDMLAFYTKNKDQLTRIFRQSPLGARKKAKRNDYIDRMINRSFDRMLPPIDIDGFKIALERFTYGRDNSSSSNNSVYNSFGKTTNGPVAQSVELAVHNRSVEGSSPSGTTIAGSHNGNAAGFDPVNIGSTPIPASKSRKKQSEYPDFMPVTDIINNIPPGLLGEIAQFIYSAAPRPVPEVALAASIGLLAGICGRAYNVSGTGLNQYILILAQTGVGKEAANSGIDRLMESIRLSVPTSVNFIGPAEISSGQALIKYLNRYPCFVSILGEFGLRLQAMSNPHGNSSEVNLRRMLLELFNKSGFGQVYRPLIYSDKDKNIEATVSPAFSILAESTPERFYGVLNEDMIAEGLLPRFNLVEYNGNRPPLNQNHLNAIPSFSLTERFASLVAQCEMIMHSKRVINIESAPDAHKIFSSFDKYCDDRINSSGSNEILRQLWNRAHIKALKISALIAVGVNMAEPLIVPDYANWAIGMVINDIKALSNKFEQGEIGSSTSELKQLQHLRAVVKEYISLEWEKAEKYKVPKNLFDDKVITGAYLSRRLAAQTSYRNDRLGSTIALKRAIQALIDADVIREISKVELANKYGTTQKAFVITNVKGLGD